MCEKVELLVVDSAADVDFSTRGVLVSVSMDESAVERIVCPATNIYTGRDSTASQPGEVFSAPRILHIGRQ